MPTVELSIVVPTRDTADLTLACLQAVARAQPSRSVETIVVDDASRDDTVPRIGQAHPSVRVIRRAEAGGFSAAANAGLAAASGALLLLLNSDTEVEPGGLDALLDAFDRDDRLGVAGAQLRNPDGSAQWSGGRTPDCLWLFAEASGAARLLARLPLYRRAKPLERPGDRDVDWVPGAALAVRRAVWDAVGPLDEAFRLYAQDLDLCSRARAAGWRVRVLHGFGVRHHHGATVTAVTGSAGRQHTPLLWTDLRRWATKRYGVRYGRRAGRALAAGGALRVAGRSIVAPLIGAARRPRWTRETRELRAALAALRGMS